MKVLKDIKVEEQVYHKLDDFRAKHETFSQALDRLLTLMARMGEVKDILEGGVKYEEWRESELEKARQKVG